jgi:O-antigen/teichoic acid export membrane protein
VVLVGTILLLEHLGADAYGPLLARNRRLLASTLIFIRSGLWPIAIIALGWLYPPSRSLEWVLSAWLAGLILAMLVLATCTLRGGRWRWLALRPHELGAALCRSWPFYLSDIGAVGSLYADRFIIAGIAGLELTGVYVFFWSAANVVHSLALYGIFQPRVPTLVSASNRGELREFRKQLLRFQGATVAWALILSVLLWCAIHVFVQYMDRPLLSAHVAIFAAILLPMLLRVLADSYHFVLFALRRDRPIAMISLAGAAGSAVLNAVLVSTAGLSGAVIASMLTAGGLLAARFKFARI